jgi:hypothetical protein
MEGGAVGHNFEMELPKDYPSQIWFNLVQRFQRRRFKCESLRRTDGRRRTPSYGKSSHGLWPGELKTGGELIVYLEREEALGLTLKGKRLQCIH